MATRICLWCGKEYKQKLFKDTGFCSVICQVDWDAEEKASKKENRKFMNLLRQKKAKEAAEKEEAAKIQDQKDRMFADLKSDFEVFFSEAEFMLNKGNREPAEQKYLSAVEAANRWLDERVRPETNTRMHYAHSCLLACYSKLAEIDPKNEEYANGINSAKNGMRAFPLEGDDALAELGGMMDSLVEK